MKSFAQQENEKLYLNTPLQVFEPSIEEISSFQFGHQASEGSDNILWLQGEYVEGGVANRNGQLWDSEEVSIKSATAKNMPVTLMHDMRTAVGVIADVKVSQEENSDTSGGTRTKMSTVLAIWAHRFPEAAQEILDNHKAGTLMQSQECDTPAYECSVCDQLFVKPVDPKNHCEHLKNGEASRRLLNVTFTGTGLIFGSRGAEGANPNAHLDFALSEVAAWSNARNGIQKQEKSTVETIEIKRTEYDELKARPSLDALEAIKTELAEAAAARDELSTKLDAAEIAQKAVADEKVAVEEELSALKSEVESDEVAKTRIEELSEDFTARLPESLRDRLAKQARAMADEEWSERIDEISEMLEIVPTSEDGVFTKEEISRFNGRGNSDPSKSEVTPHELGKGIYRMAAKK